MQSKLGSTVEVFTNTVIGYFVGLGTQYFAFPLFDIEIKLEEQVVLAAIFLVIGIIRSYIVRRAFNYYEGVKDVKSKIIT